MLRSGDVDLAHLLERNGVGPHCGSGLVGGGAAARIRAHHHFEPGLIAGHVSPERLEELDEGADPTADEESLWRVALIKRLMTDENTPQFDVWCIDQRGKKPQFVVSWKSDGGYAHAYDGVFSSIDDIRKFLERTFDAFELWHDQDSAVHVAYVNSTN